MVGILAKRRAARGRRTRRALGSRNTAAKRPGRGGKRDARVAGTLLETCVRVPRSVGRCYGGAMARWLFLPCALAALVGCTDEFTAGTGDGGGGKAPSPWCAANFSGTFCDDFDAHDDVTALT